MTVARDALGCPLETGPVISAERMRKASRLAGIFLAIKLPQPHVARAVSLIVQLDRLEKP